MEVADKEELLHSFFLTKEFATKRELANAARAVHATYEACNVARHSTNLEIKGLDIKRHAVLAGWTALPPAPRPKRERERPTAEQTALMNDYPDVLPLPRRRRR